MEDQGSGGPRVLDGTRFPAFSDGDVKIIITGSRQYQLHSSILKNSSPLLRELLSQRYTAELTTRAKKKGIVVTNILRAYPCDVQEEGALSLILKPLALDNEGRPPSAEIRLPLDLENGVAVPPEVLAYDKVLGIFYHRLIDLRDFGGRSLKEIMPGALEVLKVAEYLQCVPLLTPHFESTLLARGQNLYSAIAEDPGFWLGFAIRLQSRILYRESITHAAGQYLTPRMQDSLPSLDDTTRQIVDNMAGELEAKVKNVVCYTLSYYPEPLQRIPRVSQVDLHENSRSSYSGDILHWMALTVFRHWLSMEVALDRTYHAEDIGFDLIERLKSAGDAYLAPEDVAQFHDHFPVTTRSRNIIQEKLDEIKNYVSEWTRDLTRNRTKLDLKRHKHHYFTCARFPDGQRYPWEDADVDEADEDMGGGADMDQAEDMDDGGADMGPEEEDMDEGGAQMDDGDVAADSGDGYHHEQDVDATSIRSGGHVQEQEISAATTTNRGHDEGHDEAENASVSNGYDPDDDDDATPEEKEAFRKRFIASLPPHLRHLPNPFSVPYDQLIDTGLPNTANTGPDHPMMAMSTEMKTSKPSSKRLQRAVVKIKNALKKAWRRIKARRHRRRASKAVRPASVSSTREPTASATQEVTTSATQEPTASATQEPTALPYEWDSDSDYSDDFHQQEGATEFRPAINHENMVRAIARHERTTIIPARVLDLQSGYPTAPNAIPAIMPQAEESISATNSRPSSPTSSAASSTDVQGASSPQLSRRDRELLAQQQREAAELEDMMRRLGENRMLLGAVIEVPQIGPPR